MIDTQGKGKTYTVWSRRQLIPEEPTWVDFTCWREEHFDTLLDVVHVVIDNSEYSWNRLNHPFWKVGAKISSLTKHKTRESKWLGGYKFERYIAEKDVPIHFRIQDSKGRSILKEELLECYNTRDDGLKFNNHYNSWYKPSNKSPQRKYRFRRVGYGSCGMANKKRLEASLYQEPGQIEISDGWYSGITYIDVPIPKVGKRHKADGFWDCWDDGHNSGQKRSWKTERKTQYKIK